jgi:hypothetical protein
MVEREVRLMRMRRDPVMALPSEIFDKVLTYSYLKDIGNAARVSRCESTPLFYMRCCP